MAERILIVEDDHALASTVVDILREAGYDCVAAATRSQAITLASQFAPNAIVADYLLPDGTAGDLVEDLKGLGAELPKVIVISKHKEAEKLAATSLVHSVIPKPFTFLGLLKRLEAA